MSPAPAPAPDLADELRAAIRLRSEVRPGSAAHWRAVREVKRLQRLLVQETTDDARSPGVERTTGCAVAGCPAGGDLDVARSAVVARGIELRRVTASVDDSVRLCAGHVLDFSRAC